MLRVGRNEKVGPDVDSGAGTFFEGDNRQAIQEMISYVLKAVGDQKDSYLYCVIHSDCPDDGNALVRELAGNYGINVALPLIDIGVTVGVHIGPTALGIAYAPKPY